MTPVIFRMEKAPNQAATPIAFFPTLPGTNDPWTCTSYAHVGQHCSATRGYYTTTKPATAEELEPLRKELTRIGYELKICKRWTRDMDETRFAALG